MILTAEMLVPKQANNLSDYLYRYKKWKIASGLAEEDSQLLSARILEETDEFSRAWKIFNERPTPKNKRRTAHELGDLFNYAATIEMIEGKELDTVFSNGRSITTFDDLQAEARHLNKRSIDENIGYLYEVQSQLAESTRLSKKEDIIEGAARLILTSAAIIDELGFSLQSAAVSKLERNEKLKYNSEKMRYLIEKKGMTVEEAMKQCQEDWRPFKDILDDVFFLAHQKDPEQIIRALQFQNISLDVSVLLAPQDPMDYAS